MKREMTLYEIKVKMVDLDLKIRRAINIARNNRDNFKKLVEHGEGDYFAVMSEVGAHIGVMSEVVRIANEIIEAERFRTFTFDQRASVIGKRDKASDVLKQMEYTASMMVQLCELDYFKDEEE